MVMDKNIHAPLLIGAPTFLSVRVILFNIVADKNVRAPVVEFEASPLFMVVYTAKSRPGQINSQDWGNRSMGFERIFTKWLIRILFLETALILHSANVVTHVS